MTKPITETLHHIGGGHFISLASDQMAELVKKVKETGKAGKLTLTITVKNATRGGAMIITGVPKLTCPADPPSEAMLFATEDGELTTDNPHQRDLDLKDVSKKPETELKQINKD